MRLRGVVVVTASILWLVSCADGVALDGDVASAATGDPDTSELQSQPEVDDSEGTVAGIEAESGSDGGVSAGADFEDADSDGAESDSDAADHGVSPQNANHLGPTGEVELDLGVAKRGDNGDHVTRLQERLNDLGFATGGTDGDYGRRTETAVTTFQRISNLEPSGEVDAATITALSRYRYSGVRLVSGSEGAEVELLQERLAEGPFDPGNTDGVYGTQTVQAVWALEKLTGIPVDGDWGPADEWALGQLMEGEIGGPTNSHDTRWVEVDLSQQLMKVYEPGRETPILISHVSSGSGIPWKNEEHSGSSITPIGDFHIQRRISGWRESSLNIGRLYNPLYFTGGIAFHGATSVPLYPASHGCVRVPMHIAEYLPAELPNGTPVHVMS